MKEIYEVPKRIGLVRVGLIERRSTKGGRSCGKIQNYEGSQDLFQIIVPSCFRLRRKTKGLHRSDLLMCGCKNQASRSWWRVLGRMGELRVGIVM